MPQKEDKWKAFFADLGRPTLRGIRKCPKCGTVNGTRGNSCKNKTCDVIFRGNGSRKKSSLEACLITNMPDCSDKAYSVRVRDRGPDYRTFVQFPSTDNPSTGIREMDTAEGKCYVEQCSTDKQQASTCNHVLAARKCFSSSQSLPVKPTVLASLNIPDEFYGMLSHLINELPHQMVQRVSKSSFVVKCQPSDRHPLGFLHIMFMKVVKDDALAYKKFLCTCRPFKVPSRDPEQPSSSDHGFKLCLHYFACLCAFASNDELASEFDHVLSHATHEFSQPMLSQLQLVTQSSSDKSMEQLDPNHHISVEIMRENISLLESIAAGDDPSLVNVQGLDGVLADQIIVTNVDDTLSFSDAAVLESLEDAEQQVCQIFSNSQNTIQLTTYTTSSSDQLHDLEMSAAATLSGINEVDDIVEHSGAKRRRENRNVAFAESSKTHNNLVISQMPVIKTSTKSSNFQNTTNNNNRAVTESISSVEKNPELIGFENWLAGVNDLINSTMNYQLPNSPAPMVYFVSSEYFEYLKERISSGVKKRRLPNQTLVFHRTDKAPLGTFTKHVWKITNILHVLHIFSSSIVPLKTKQFFVKSSAGNFLEWIPPKNEDEKNQRILPVLHSTFLKCGKNHDSSAKESIPFVIEWIPEILPKSKLGELTLSFEFGRTGPIHQKDDDGRQSVFRIPKSY